MRACACVVCICTFAQVCASECLCAWHCVRAGLCDVHATLSVCACTCAQACVYAHMHMCGSRRPTGRQQTLHLVGKRQHRVVHGLQIRLRQLARDSRDRHLWFRTGGQDRRRGVRKQALEASKVCHVCVCVWKEGCARIIFFLGPSATLLSRAPLYRRLSKPTALRTSDIIART